MLWRRIEIGIQADAINETAEKVRRGKAEAQRIMMEARCLDCAMSAVDKLESDAAVIETLETLAGDDTWTTRQPEVYFRPTGKFEFEKLGDVNSVTSTYPSGVTITQYWRNGALVGKKAEPIHDPEWVVPERGTITRADIEMTDGHQLHQDPDAPVVDYILGCMSVGLGELAEKINPTQETGMRAAIRGGLFKYDRERAEARKSIIDEAVQKAVSAIHAQARRFMEPCSYREHQFLRDVVQEEIEKVVGGVL